MGKTLFGDWYLISLPGEAQKELDSPESEDSEKKTSSSDGKELFPSNLSHSSHPVTSSLNL